MKEELSVNRCWPACCDIFSWFPCWFFWAPTHFQCNNLKEWRGVHRVLEGKPERKRLLGRPSRRWRIILRWIFISLYSYLRRVCLIPSLVLLFSVSPMPIKGYYYYYYYYYYYRRILSQAFSSWYLSWTSGDPHRSGFKRHTAVLSVLCVMFQV
jgi:hypothetical protein